MYLMESLNYWIPEKFPFLSLFSSSFHRYLLYTYYLTGSVQGAGNKKSLRWGLHLVWWEKLQYRYSQKKTKPILPVLLFLLSEETVFSLRLKRFYGFKGISNEYIYNILDIYLYRNHAFLNSILKAPVT